MALDDGIRVAKNYRENIYFVFKLDEPTLLEGRGMTYEYACILRFP